jgi:DAK2 domain fusion protein YloV
VLDQLDAGAVREWAVAAAVALEERRIEIDSLNVFPVADSDTGTNLAFTWRAGADAASSDDSGSAAIVLATLARGAVLGARGNSGVIISQLLRGLADGLNGTQGCDGLGLRRALRSATTRAYESVGRPLEGTILSVANGAAKAAERLPADAAALGDVVAAAVEGAITALLHTPEQLQVLADAGVVDAGGHGLVVVLDSLRTIVTGAPSALPGLLTRGIVTAGIFTGSIVTGSIVTGGIVPGRRASSREIDRETGNAAFEYEVQYLLEASEPAVGRLRAVLDELGDSLAVVGTGEGVWNVHVHVNDVGAALEAGLEAGRPHRISVSRFADQVISSQVTGSQVTSSVATGNSAQPGPVAVIALVPAAGLAELFVSEDVAVVIVDATQHGSPDDGVSGEQDTVAAVRAARKAGAAKIVLLPNDGHLAMIADRAVGVARAEGIDAVVVPTRSAVQGLAAVAVHDAQRRPDDDIIAMADAAAATRFAEVHIADGEGLTTVGSCQAGDVLGLIDGEVVQIGRSVDEMSLALLDRLLGTGGELITAVIGPSAPPETESAIRRHIAERAPMTELVVYTSDVSDCPLLIGME